MHVANKVIVVTGAGSGIGRALARQLVARDAKVAAVDLRTEAIQPLQDEFGKNNVRLYPLDISDRAATKKLPSQVVQDFGHVDGLINCAGIIQPFVRINELDYDTTEHIMNVNFYGTLYLTKSFLPLLLERPEAHIINVSSMGGFLPVPGQAVYGASKAAVKLLTEALYAELLDTSVRVTIVFPGATKTNIAQNSKVATPQGAGSVDDSKFPMLSADQAAVKILRGIEKNKPQIFTGKDSNLMNCLYRLSPVRATRLIAKQMRSLLD